jgi:hypothetical protein
VGVAIAWVCLMKYLWLFWLLVFIVGLYAFALSFAPWGVWLTLAGFAVIVWLCNKEYSDAFRS